MIDDALIESAASGDADAAATLDARGLLVGRGETAAEYGERLRALRHNTLAMREGLARDGRYEIEGLEVAAAAEIPPPHFEAAAAATRSLYAFAIDWVPGFFIDPSFSLLFGGCAFYFYPDFFALFIIRKCFAERERWLIYNRTELLAHELCHVARVALQSVQFEETFAYQTSKSRFRRWVGSVFRQPADSFLFLGSTLLLLAAQVVRTLVLPRLWIIPFWLSVAGVFAFFTVRQVRHRRRFGRAAAHLDVLVPGSGLAVLFRCTDEEVLALADLGEPPALREWLEERRRGGEFRWQVLARRFPQLFGEAAAGST